MCRPLLLWRVILRPPCTEPTLLSRAGPPPPWARPAHQPPWAVSAVGQSWPRAQALGPSRAEAPPPPPCGPAGPLLTHTERGWTLGAGAAQASPRLPLSAVTWTWRWRLSHGPGEQGGPGGAGRAGLSRPRPPPHEATRPRRGLRAQLEGTCRSPSPAPPLIRKGETEAQGVTGPPRGAQGQAGLGLGAASPRWV